MTFNSSSSTFLDKEQEALWYLGSQRIIHMLAERIKGTFHLTEFVTPAGTRVSAHRQKHEDEALYVLEGEATVSCRGQGFPIRAGSFLFLPGKLPHLMQVSPSGPLRYLTWMTPAGFVQDVTKMGIPESAFLLASPPVPESVKVQHLASLLRRSAL